jgi:predicted patatin/cPLA2 family phospholipase
MELNQSLKDVLIENTKPKNNLHYNANDIKSLEFEKVVDTTLQQIRDILIEKGKEYRRNNNPFHNFEVGAKKKSISREKVLDGMLLKHEISIDDMTNDLDLGKLPAASVVNEKFNDNLIYLIIKKAMFLDRIKKITSI